MTGSRIRPTVRWEQAGRSAVEVTAGRPARVLDHSKHPIPDLRSPYPDIAVIEIPELIGHPCVAVDDDWPQDPDCFYVCSYPREGGAERLTPARLSYRGEHGTDPVAYLDLAGDRVKPGMSGAAVLNLRTEAVCGVLVATKNLRQPDGGLAVHWRAIRDDLTDLLTANRAFHQLDQRWKAAGQRQQRRRPPGVTRPRPENFEPRDDLVRQAKDVLLAPNPGGSARVVGLVGMGGTGKSVLAAELARDDEVKQAFDDGIVWLDFGPQADPVARQRQLVAAFGGGDRWAVDSQHRLRDLDVLLSGARCLVILDDVGQRKQLRYFELSVPESALLVTARDRTVLGQSGMVRSVPVDILPPEPSWRLLAAWAGLHRPDLPPPEAREVATQCDGLPLALSIAGAMVAQGHSWRYLRDAIDGADLHELLVGLPYYPDEYKNLFRVLDVSVSSLEGTDRDRYLALAVFEGRGAVPAEAVIRLWRELGLTEHDSERLIISLDRRSLLRYDNAAGTMSMHSLQYTYARGRLGEERLRSLHGLLADSILGGWGGLAGGLRGLPSSPIANRVERYGVVQLAAHLKAAGRDDDIHQLLALSEPPAEDQHRQTRNAWYAAHTRVGETIAYDADLRMAWNRAIALADQSRADARAADAIGLELRYGLMSASLSSLTAGIPPALITELVTDGQWTTSLGVRHARMLPAEASARTLAGLLAYISQTDGDGTVSVTDLAGEALVAARAVSDPFTRATILAALAAHPPSRAEAIREAWQAIGVIPAELPRARAIAALVASAKRLPKRMRDEALRLASVSESPRSLTVILTALAPQVPVAERAGIIVGAWRAARQIGPPEARFTELTALLPSLAADERAVAAAQARAAAEDIPAGLNQVSAFVTLAAHLHDRGARNALLLRAERVAGAVSQSAEKATALAAVASRVPAKRYRLLGLAYDATCAETDPAARANALIALVALDRESAQLWTKAEEAIAAIGQRTARVIALTALAGTLDQGSHRSALLARALAEASPIDDAPARAAALAALIAHVPERDDQGAESTVGQAIDQALGDALAFSQPTQVAVAAALAPVARERRAAILKRASVTARDLRDPRDRVTALTALIPLLTDTARDDAIGRACRAAADITEQRQQRAALLALLAAAPDAVSWHADAVTRAVLAVDDRVRELCGAVVAAGADIEDRSTMLATILSAPAPARPGLVGLLPAETGAVGRGTISRDAEPLISAIGELRARAAALLILIEADVSDAAGACLARKTSHAVEQARKATQTVGALLRELPAPLRDQLMAAGQAVETAARLAASGSPAHTRTAEPPPGQPPGTASMPPWAPDLRDLVDDAAGRGRGVLLSELPALAPAIARYGGGCAVTEAIQALLDIGRWWP